VEDFDETQRKVLDAFLCTKPEIQSAFTDSVKNQLINAWHEQKAWPGVAEAVKKLKQERRFEVYVHANGSTRLQLDLVQSAGLQFDMLFSSELLGSYKPAPESYEKVLQLLKLTPDECVTVAAHSYDLRGANSVGMKTVYVYRWTDDIMEDQGTIKKEFDRYLLDMNGLDTAIVSLK